MNNKGFTLIELLVVIAIIGILAGIIIVSLDGTSDDANFARVKSDMNQIRTQMEITRTQTGVYPLVGTVASNLVADIDASGGTATVTFPAAAGGTAYCYQVTGQGSVGTWCVDSTGYSGASGGCDTTNLNCAAE